MKKCLVMLLVVCCMFVVFAEDDIQTIISKFSYFIGANTFAQNEEYYGINAADFARGAIDYENGEFSMSNSEIQNVINAFSAYLNEKVEKLKTENLKYAEDFLAKNKKQSGVITTTSGLQYKITKKGNGAKARTNGSVEVYYKLTLPDGTVVDKADASTGSASFSLSGVIPGFAEACRVAPAGSKLTAWIHPSLGYGENGSGSIEPNTLLTFEIEILSVK